MKYPEWNKIRFEMTTRQLKNLAKEKEVDISDIPVGSQMKRRIAKRLADKIGMSYPRR